MFDSCYFILICNISMYSYTQDPDSFKEAKLSSHGSSSEQDIDDQDGKTDGDNHDEDDVPKDWDYIRVDGLGFIPGLCCPHHDRIQSNGILRAHDFDEMLLRHPTEVREYELFIGYIVSYLSIMLCCACKRLGFA